jgi:hypothetical protein
LNGPSDGQSFRWTGEIFLAVAGTYTFYISSDGPQRLSLGGSALIDDFTTPSGTTRHASYTAAAAGWVTISYEVADLAGGSWTQAYLAWSTPYAPVVHDIVAQETNGAAGGGSLADHMVLRYASDPASRGTDDDFYLSSTAGSWHGVVFAADAADSPAIDAGDLNSVFSNESDPNGGRINLGFEGNTAQASRSSAPKLQLLSPNGFEKYRIDGGVIIDWRTIGQVDFVDLAVSLDGGATFTPIASGLPNNGHYGWNPAGTSNRALLRISSTLDGAVKDVSDNFFTIGAAGTAYYVNDGSRTGDVYTTSAGDNANSGTTPGDPMKSINAVLSAYAVKPGDVIYVDTGYYQLPTNVRIAAADAGVRIQGPTVTNSIGASYANAVLVDQPLAYYRFGDPSGTTALDGSGHALDAPYVNGAVPGGSGALPGNTDGSVKLDGTNDYVSLPTGFSDFTAGLTLEIWVNPSAAQRWARLFDLGKGQASENIFLARYDTTNDLFLQVYNGSSAGGSLRASGILEFNKWQHIVATVDASGNARIYKNGILWTTGNVNVPVNTPRTSNFIGRSNWPDSYYAGGFDEAAIYDHVLSADRVAQHYYAGVGTGAILDRGNAAQGAFAFELNDADSVTLSNLAITGAYDGIWLGNGSTRFTLQQSRVFENADAGLNITDAASNLPIITDSVFYGDVAQGENRNQNYGVYIRGQDPVVLRNQAYHVNGSQQYGIYLDNVGTAAVVRDNLVFNNSDTGLLVVAGGFEASGNVAYGNNRGFYYEDNTGPLVSHEHEDLAYFNTTGFELRGNGEHYNLEGHDNGTGLYTANGAMGGTVHDIVMWRNTTGVSWSGGRLDGARVYGNTGTGIYLGGGNWSVTGSRVYDNATGIYDQGYFGENVLANNLVYDSRDRGIGIDNGQTSSGTLYVTNNTVMELGADAVQLLSGTRNVQLRNNVLWAGGTGHYAVNVAGTAQAGFGSDYNLVWATGGAKIGFWQMDFGTLADWRYELGFDTHSLSADPMFVDPDGADNVRGYADTAGLKFEYFANGTFAGTPVTTLYDRSVDFGGTYGAFRGLNGPSDGQSFRWTGEIFLAVAGTYTFYISSDGPQRLSLGGSVIVDDASPGSGLEQKGTYTALAAGWVSISYEVADLAGGSWTQAALAWSTPDLPVRRDVMAVEAVPGGGARQVLRYQATPGSDGRDDNFHLQSASGSYRPLTGLWTADPGTSPAIDAGDLASAFSQELASNGARINLGFEGNTPEASHSPTQYIQLLSFNGGDKVRQGQASLVRWRSSGVGNVDLWFSANGGATWTRLAAGELNDGVFAWNPATPTLHGRLRISDSSVTDFGAPGAVYDISDADFTVGAPGNLYYVNDGSTVGDQYSSAAGSNNNSGTTPADPMASLNALLNVYDLGPGDVVYVDNGYYALATNVRIGPDDSGVTIQGPTATTTFSAGYAQLIAADSPMLYYRFDEVSGTLVADSSGNGRTGTYVNGVQLAKQGALAGSSDTSVSLDGSNDYISLPSGFQSFPNGFTYELWVFPTAVANYQRFLELANGQASDNIVLYRRGGSNDLSFTVYNGSTAGTEITASGVLELNRWQQIAVTMDATGAARLYKNGVQVASGQTNVPNSVVRTSNFIGRSNWSTDPYLAAGIDEAALYDHVLAPERLQAHYRIATGDGALLDRGNVTTGRYAIEVAGARSVTVRNLELTGGEWGLVGNDSDGLVVQNNLALNNATGGFYINTDVTDAVISGNTAYGTTGNTNIDQDTGFYLRGDRMAVFNNKAYKIGSQLGDGIDVDSADQLVFHDNLAYNNANGITLTTSQADVYANEARDNRRGIYVTDDNGNARTQVHNNLTHDNDGDGLVLESTVEAYANVATVNTGSGIVLTTSGNSIARDNYVTRNGTGIYARSGQVLHNRVVGNAGAGIYTDYQATLISGNSVYGNARGIEVASPYGTTIVQDNLVYDNTNYGIYLHGAGSSGTPGTLVLNNTVMHEVGSAVRLENNGNNVRLYNNILYINGGLGIELIGNAAGFDSNYNDIYPGRPGANVGRFQSVAISATLAAWQAASGEDANSKSADPLFLDTNGGDNILGWEQPDPQSQFADFGGDDNFHLRGGSPAIDSADGETGPSTDADGRGRVDDLGTLNTGNGVFRFYDMGAFEFNGSSADVTPPVVTALLPVGLTDNVLSNARFSTLVVRFSELLDPVSAASPSLYQLVEAGPDGVLGNGNDVVVPLAGVTYSPGDLEVRLSFDHPLAEGLYRLTITSGVVGAVVDQTGNALDGDANGTAGGNFVRSFQLDLTAPTVQSVTPSGSVATGPTKITVVFADNLQLNASTVTNVASYGLLSSVDETFGNADDVNEIARVTTITYDAGTRTAVLNLTGALPARHYQLTLRTTIADQAGNALGGGSNYIAPIDVGVPVLNPIGDKQASDGVLLTFTATATDPDHSGSLVYTLGPGAPTGALITAGGLFSWTPNLSQAGQSYDIRVVVTDNNAPPLSDSELIHVTVSLNPTPSVISTAVNGGAGQRSRVTSVSLVFNQNVGASLTTADLILRNVTTGVVVPSGSLALAYNAANNTATLTFPGLAGQRLADGRYELTVVAAGVTGAGGKAMAADYKLSFHALTGDANGDAATNDLDLFVLWQNSLKAPAAQAPGLDLTGDGVVTAADIAVVKGNYLASLAPAPVVLNLADLGGSPSAESADVDLSPVPATTVPAVGGDLAVPTGAPANPRVAGAAAVGALPTQGALRFVQSVAAGYGSMWSMVSLAQVDAGRLGMQTSGGRGMTDEASGGGRASEAVSDLGSQAGAWRVDGINMVRKGVRRAASGAVGR